MVLSFSMSTSERRLSSKAEEGRELAKKGEEAEELVREHDDEARGIGRLDGPQGGKAPGKVKM
jgi:hypothetical protein